MECVTNFFTSRVNDISAGIGELFAPVWSSLTMIEKVSTYIQELDYIVCILMMIR